MEFGMSEEPNVIFNEPFLKDGTTDIVCISVKFPRDYPVGEDMPTSVLNKGIDIVQKRYNIGTNPIPSFDGRLICFKVVS